MKAKVHEKEKSIILRKKGYSYNDILKEVPVAKSTLSSWLKDLPLTKEEKRYLRGRRDKNISRGRIKAATAHRRNRIKREQEVFEEAKKEFVEYVKDPLFQIGVSLYWAEGAKKTFTFQFVNSDPDMIELMVRWIEKFLKRNKQELDYRLYIHKPYAHEKCEEFWSDVVKVPAPLFKKTIYKPTERLYKKNKTYKGCFRVALPRGKKALMKMAMWQKLLIEKHRDS